MIPLKEKYRNFLLAFFIYLISITIVFRKIATIILIVFFVVMMALNYKKHRGFFKENKKYVFLLIISSPLLLEILFFWNNETFLEGIKSLEKSLACFFLPLTIIPLYKKIDFKKTLKIYSYFSVLTLVLFFFLFIVFRQEYFYKYLRGIHLWEMGYEYSRFIGIHAPALNMYVSFISVFLFSEILNKLDKEHKINPKILVSVGLFLISFFFLLLINTRIAIVTFFIGAILVFIKSNLGLKIKIRAFVFIASILLLMSTLFIKKFPFIIEKFTTQITTNLDKIGKLDEIENTEEIAYSSLVSRLSIWKASFEIGCKNFYFGVGSSDANEELIKHYKETNQHFLAKYGFATHNQTLNFFLKFGIIGVLCCLMYLFYPLYLGINTKNILIICFFVNFFISNITDDYLNKFDGIVYSSFWYSIFTAYFLQIKEEKNG